MAGVAQHDGNGRLWERFELANINDRIENIYQHFKNQTIQRIDDSSSSSYLGLNVTEQQEYLDKIRNAISNQLNELIKDLEIKYNEKTKTWKDENIKLKSEINDLKNRLRDRNRENNDFEKEKRNLENKYNSLRNGLDQIINDSNIKNQDRIKKLNQQIQQIENERNKAIQNAKKDKKLHDSLMNELQEKMDKLERKYRKISNDRSDLLTDRDNLALKCSNLERIIRENRDSENDGLKSENDSLRDEINKLRTNFDELLEENNRLNEEYNVLSDKYELEKDAFKRTISKQEIAKHFANNESIQKQSDESHQKELNRLRLELNKEHEKQLKQREKEWTKAKNDSIKILDSEYNELKEEKEKQIQRLIESNNELKRICDDNKDEIQRLRKDNLKLDELRDRIQGLNDALNEKGEELINLKTELSKYKILWQHFFGLDAPLKDEIERVNNKLDEFENYHHIQSPIPKKKRRIVIESLSQWTDKRRPPLILDAIPSPKDEYQRFELYNIHNKVIELKGFKLENGRNDIINLDSRQIKPGGYIGIALKKKKNRFDILYKGENIFCQFTDGEGIWLCDSFDEKIQIFPITEVIYDNLTVFQGDSPIFVKKLFVEDPGYKGFEFGNQIKRKIKLKNMYFKNKQNTLNLKIPFKSLPRNGIIKLIITDNPNNPRIGKNDLVISPDKIQIDKNDSLLLCDSYGNSVELYNMDGAAIDIENMSPKSSKTRSNECFIM